METIKKRQGGRPKKTLDDLPKGWKEEIIDMGSKGCSDVEMKAFLRVSNDLWTRLLEEEEEFSETVKEARSLCHAWWERMGREGLINKYQADNLNPTLWYMNMKNRFGWADKREDTVDVKVEGVISYPVKKELGEE